MNKFSRYLDAARFCREHNLSLAAINKTGNWQYVVIFDDNLIVSTGNYSLPKL